MILYISASISLQAQTFWERFAFSDTSISSLSINSSGDMIVGIDYHSLYYSNHAESKWIKVPVPNIILNFTSIDDSGIVYVADTDAFDSSLQKTSDLGQNWKVISDSGTLGCYSLGIKSNGEILATFTSPLGSHSIYHSFDHGLSWEKDSIDFEVSLLNNLNTQSVYVFGNGDTIFVIGTDGIYQSINNGKTWSKKNSGLAASNVITLCKNNLGNLYLQGNFIGTIGGLYRSNDSAENWEEVNTTGLPQFYDFYQLITDSNNILYGISNEVYKSTDEGDSWTDISAGLPGSLNNILAVGPDGGIYCGTNLGLYKSTNNLSSVEKDFINPNNFSLNQNYPNPFNPVTSIQYSIPKRSSVTIKIYDVLGNEISTLVNEEKPLGSYEIKFNASNYPSGIYFYKLQADTFTETKKMLLLK